jgi:hypothetical protein
MLQCGNVRTAAYVRTRQFRALSEAVEFGWSSLTLKGVRVICRAGPHIHRGQAALLRANGGCGNR